MDRDADTASSPAAGQVKKKRGGWLRRLVMVRRPRMAGDGSDELARRRADSHPDAPPRPPLMASRDLPPPAPVGTVSIARREPDGRMTPAAFLAPQFAPPAAAPDQPEDEPHLPDIFAGLEEPAPRTEYGAHTPLAFPSPVFGATARDTGLATMLARFEHGLARRIAVIEAEEASEQLSERLIFAQQDPTVRNALRALRPVEVTPAPLPEATSDTTARPPANDLDDSVEAQLSIALGALRKLAEQGRR